MLTNTFLHLPKIGPKKEDSLWSRGIYTWDDFIAEVPKHEIIFDSQKHLADRNPRYFADNLKAADMWRLFEEFRDEIVYLDIETTGLDRYYESITTIATYDGKKVKTYVNGENLTQFKRDISRYKVIVTFNGNRFDVPFIEHNLRFKLDHAHIDLRSVLHGLGYTGSLKDIEIRLGVDRKELAGVDGDIAVMLWSEYQRNDNEKALETLLAYNVADVVNLEVLLVKAYNLSIGNTPFGNGHKLKLPKGVLTSYKANDSLLRRLMRRRGMYY